MELPKCAITKRWTGEILATGETLKAAAESEADLRGADLSEADLRVADLSEANLSGADGLPSDLIIPNIDAAILTAIETDGNKLDMDDWHRCETTHCRAGWAIHLAGPAGYELEKKIGPNAAGALIYAVSRPDKRIPNFGALTDEALADIRKCAAEQLAGETP